jgi:hypothetical protein
MMLQQRPAEATSRRFGIREVSRVLGGNVSETLKIGLAANGVMYLSNDT